MKLFQLAAAGFAVAPVLLARTGRWFAVRIRCGDGGWTTSVGGLLEASANMGLSAVGDEAGVPMEPSPDEVAIEVVVSAGEQGT